LLGKRHDGGTRGVGLRRDRGQRGDFGADDQRAMKVGGRANGAGKDDRGEYSNSERRFPHHLGEAVSYAHSSVLNKESMPL
jgi:hypothetical protein